MWPRPLNPFQVSRNGVPIWRYDLRRPVNTGISIDPLTEDIVPEFECREAARYCNYTAVQFWNELEREERAACVAQYRISRLVEMHAQDAVNTKMETESRRRSSKG